MGRRWYESGKYLNKKKTFEDFIACAERLVEGRYTSPDRLCIEGRSAGGLTMGAVVNMRPDLFKAAIMGVPFVDCLTTMLDPVRKWWWGVGGVCVLGCVLVYRLIGGNLVARAFSHTPCPDFPCSSIQSLRRRSLSQVRGQGIGWGRD